MDNSEIVEIYSAANSIEAYALANMLNETGIESRVVGDVLGMAGGGLPLGQTTTPRVWVLKADEARAKELIEEYKSILDHESKTSSIITNLEADELMDVEIAKSAEELEAPISEESHRGFLSPLLAFGGIACIILGIIFAIYNHRLLSFYSETAEAQYSKFTSIYSQSRTVYYFTYNYKVGNDQYSIVIEGTNYRGKSITVRYNPKNPADGYAETIANPFLCLAIGGIFGVFSLFLTYQFRT